LFRQRKSLSLRLSSLFVILLFLFSRGILIAQPPVHPANSSHEDFIDISTFENVKLDKRYASANNFCGEILDTNKFSASLHPIATEKFLKACQILAKEKPGWKFVVFDAYRPLSVQKKLYEHVRGTPKAHYVAYPSYGIHCYGFAIDLSLIDNKNKELDMGTDYDDLSALAEPRYEAKFLHEGKLSKQQYENRMLLRRIMKEAGFHQLQREWWHYEALPEHIVRANYRQKD
jgi:D-alanyl-D-alanine dipeptidase